MTSRCRGAGFQPARQFGKSLHVCAELKNTFPAGQVENLLQDMRVRGVIADTSQKHAEARSHFLIGDFLWQSQFDDLAKVEH